MAKWYPSYGWETFPDYRLRYKWDSYDGYTDILIARAGLNDEQCDEDHIHIYQVNSDKTGITYRDSDGRIFNLSEHDIKMILAGHRPLL